MKNIFPLENYKVNGYKFGQFVSDWGIHLGEDCNTKEGTSVKSIANGKVVYAALHPGSIKKRNWGYIIIIKHKVFKKKQFYYSLYAHLGNRLKNIGDKIKAGEIIGLIGKSNTPENGWWTAHLHFAIYTGPWNGNVLPGYYKEGQRRTKISYWQNPTKWILKHSK